VLRGGSWIWTLVIGALAAMPSATASAAPLGHHGDALVRVEASPAEVEARGRALWCPRTATPSVVARVTLQQRALLDVSGLAYEVLDPDLGPHVEAERARLLTAPPVQGGLDPAFYDEYRNLDAVLARLDVLVTTRPDRAASVDVGTSLEGRPIRGVRITNPSPEDRPIVVVQGCQHAREWISVTSTMFAAEQFATAAEGSEIDVLLDQVELVIVPVANPDGYVHSWDVDRFWRKNRRDGIGVDVNRNWSLAWGGEGSSGEPSDENYRGTSPFSEPETEAMRDLLDDPRVLAHLDVHSYGQLVLFPWGYDAADTDDHELFAGLAADIADVMTSRHQQQYLPLQTAELYPASGNAIDWAYGNRGIYAVALELRPGPESEFGFVLLPASIVPTGEEVVEAITELIESTVELGPGEPGGADLGPIADDTTGGFDDASDGGTSSDGFSGTTGAPTPTTSEPSDSPFDTSVTTGTDDDTAAQDEEFADGCACHQGRSASRSWWALATLVLGLRRRRARSVRLEPPQHPPR
jgi:carboxypeptidase T